MSSTTPRRIYIDRGPSREEAIIRRVLVPQGTPTSGSPRATAANRKNAETLFGLGRLVRGQLLRRPR